MILKESFCGNCRLTLLVTCSILRDNTDEAVNSLDFAKRAKMIKKKVSKNVVLSPAELEFLANGLKEEIMNLRGQIVKSGGQFSLVKNKRLLAYIKNDEVTLDGDKKAEEGEAEAEEKPKEAEPKGDVPSEDKPKEDEDKPSQEEKPNDKPIPTESLGTRTGGIPGIPNNRGNIAVRKRASLLELDEETIIMKYCELKAKLENLQEATMKRFAEDEGKEIQAENVIDEFKDDANKKIVQIDEKRMEQVGQINEKVDQIKEEFAAEKAELEKKIALMTLENSNKDKEMAEKEERIMLLMGDSDPDARDALKEKILREQIEKELAPKEDTVSKGKVTELEDELAKSKIDLEFKIKETEDIQARWDEHKDEIKIVQSMMQRLELVKKIINILFINLFRRSPKET
jgi:hypothetical protein